MIQHRRISLGSAYPFFPTFVMINRRWLIALVASLALFGWGPSHTNAAPPAAPHVTLVSGDITANTLWTKVNSPYQVTGMLRVLEDATLTIEPGVQVFVDDQIYIIVYGSLIAEGNSGLRITFSGTTAQSGSWRGISVGNSMEKPASVTFDYVTVEHAGRDSAYNGGGLEIGRASVAVRHSIFRDNGANGINAVLTSLTSPFILEDTAFNNNGLNAVRLESTHVDPQLSNLTATGNGTEGEGYNAVVYVTTIWDTGDHILEYMNLPYVFKNKFTVGTNARLIMQPRIEVQVEAGFSFGLYINGALEAIGNSGQRITITGITKQPGSWEGINVAGTFGDLATADLDYVILDYGGLADADSYANLSVYLANVTVRNTIISNGGKHGIYNSGGAPTEPSSLLVENTTFTNNAGAAIKCTDESCNQTLHTLVATGNGLNAMVQRFAMAGNVIWTKMGLPYIVEGFTGINQGSTLVIEPGVEVHMGEDASFDVSGALFAIGTSAQPILFTGTQQEPGWWDNISVHDNGFLELRYCDVGYGGVAGEGMLTFSTNAAFVSNCRLHHSAEAAIHTLLKASPVVNHNLIEANAAGIINGNTTAFPMIIDARDNWWGSPTGPSHPSNPSGTGNSVTDLVLFDPWLQSPQAVSQFDMLVVQIGGVGRYSPGETVQYAIAYFNPTAEVVDDAVLRVALPANSKYIDSTGGGIFWPERGQMFWKLGDLAPNAAALLTVRVTFAWGLPDGLKTAIVAQLGGRGVDESLFNVEEYLNYVPRVETGVTNLSEAQVQTLRANDAKMDAIYDQAEADSYLFGSATEQTYNTGQSLTQVILLKVVEKDIRAYIIWREPSDTVGVALDGSGLTVYKPGKGLRFSLQTKQWQETDAGLANTSQLASTQALSWTDCMKNCIIDKLPGEIAEELVKAYGVGKKVLGCIQAISGDSDAILECSKIIGEAIPGYGPGVELGTCNVDCKECESSGLGCDDDKCHCCTANKRRCAADDWIYGTFDIDVIMVHRCKDGKYLPEEVETVCAICEKCVMSSGTPTCVAKNPQAIQVGSLKLTWVVLGPEPVRADLTLVNATGDQECEECRRAKDPNAITGPTGDLLPAQLVTYTIEYENVGTGTAFDVFIVNPLNEYFDLDTLTVAGDATFSLSKATRRLYFTVGDLASQGQAGSKGEVTYSVRLKTELPSGTVIVNDAVVHFPSVPEETPTNVAVNTIQPIAVPSQHLQVVAGQSLPIVLAGKDVNDGALTFAIVDAPDYGTLAGTAPTLTYTPQANFAGIDRMIFTADNGTATSRLAEVVLEVLPGGGDGVAPTVKWTGPENGAIVDSSQQVANLENGSLYSPYLQIQFSEAMAATTVNSTTIEVKDGGGQVVPSSVQYDATLDQAVILMQQPGQSQATFTVTVKNGVTDLAGTPMAANYVWTFKFGDLTAPGTVYLPFAQK